MDFHRCYTGCLCLLRSEDDFIRIASVVVTMVVAMTCMSMGICLGCLSFMSVVMTFVVVVVALVIVFMTMPFVIVGVSFVRMVVPFVVMVVAFVAMTRIA